MNPLCTHNHRSCVTTSKKQDANARSSALHLSWLGEERHAGAGFSSPPFLTASLSLPRLRGGLDDVGGGNGARQKHEPPQLRPADAEQGSPEACAGQEGIAICLAAAKAMKEEGNAAFVGGDAGGAMAKYTEAYKTLAAVEPGTDEQMYERSLLQVRSRLKISS